MKLRKIDEGDVMMGIWILVLLLVAGLVLIVSPVLFAALLGVFATFAFGPSAIAWAWNKLVDRFDNDSN